jgi:ureidoglycolate dehydrogenase (NAD+)
MFTKLDESRRLGAFFLMLDPLCFAGGRSLPDAVEAIARALLAESGSPRMPGDSELAQDAMHRARSIPIEPGLAAQMRVWTTRLGVGGY